MCNIVTCKHDANLNPDSDVDICSGFDDILD